MTQNKRMFKIFILLQNNTEGLTGKKLAGFLKISSRTLYNDIKELNDIVKQNGASIDAKPGRGYALVVNDKEKYKKLRGQLFSEHIMKDMSAAVTIRKKEHMDCIMIYIMENILLRKRLVLQEDLADELFVSLSTLKRYLYESRQYLKRFNLILNANRRRGIYLEGDESQIRYVISEYVFQQQKALEGSEWSFWNGFFSIDRIRLFKQILSDIIQKRELHFTDMALRRLVVHLLITIKRHDMRNVVAYDDEMRTFMERTEYFYVVQELLWKIKGQLGIDIISECYYLTQQFVVASKFVGSAEVQDEYQRLSMKILETIRLCMGIDLLADRELIMGLALHLSVAVNRLAFRMNMNSELFLLVREDYPLALELAILAGEVIEKQKDIHINEAEIDLLIVHFAAALERNGQETREKKQALIVCGASIAVMFLLKAQIQRYFGDSLEIKEAIPYHELTTDRLDEVDLVFSTMAVENVISEKIIRVDPILTRMDRVFIQEKIDSGMIDYRKLFKENLFWRDWHINDAGTVLFRIMEKLQDEGLFETKMQQQVMTRFRWEDMRNMTVKEMVAIYHVVVDHTKDAFVSVTLLDRPICWNSTMVQLVFLLGVPAPYYRLMELIMKKIQEVFIMGNGVDVLQHEGTYAALLDVLQL